MLNCEFHHWLYGYFKLSDDCLLTSNQLWIIKNHLNLVFAVENYLDEDNGWLDGVILSLVQNNKIVEPPISLVEEIYKRYVGE